MADILGATSIALTSAPATPVTVDVSDSDDPALVYLGSYLQAVANARLGARWGQLLPNTNPVVRFFPYDPALGVYNDKYLPALFVWRQFGEPERIVTNDVIVSTDTLHFFWIAPQGGPQDKITRRQNFARRLGALFTRSLRVGRDPAWVVAGDSDTQAAALGSNIHRLAGVNNIRFTRWEPAPFRVEMVEGDPIPYDAWRFIAEVTEMGVGDDDRNIDLGGANASLHTTDDGFGDGGKILNQLELR